MRAESARPLVRLARVAAVVVALDAATKALAATQLAERDVALGGPLSLALTYNDTFARGLDLGPFTAPATFALTIAFVALAAVACTALARLDDRAPRALGLVSGAAVANALDFAHTGRGAIDFAAVATADGAIVFNLADVAAYAGVLLLAGTAVAVCRAIGAEARVDRRISPVAAAQAAAVRRAALRVRTGEVVRPVPLFVEPSAGGRAPLPDRADVPAYPPPHPRGYLLPDDVAIVDAPALRLER